MGRLATFIERRKYMYISLTFLRDIFAQYRSYEWGMGPGMMGWGFGIGWVWTILMVAFWIAIIVGIFFFIRWIAKSSGSGSREAKSEDSATEILKKRYARGEINKEEFEEKKRDMEG